MTVYAWKKFSTMTVKLFAYGPAIDFQATISTLPSYDRLLNKYFLFSFFIILDDNCFNNFANEYAHFRAYKYYYYVRGHVFVNRYCFGNAFAHTDRAIVLPQDVFKKNYSREETAGFILAFSQ